MQLVCSYFPTIDIHNRPSYMGFPYFDTNTNAAIILPAADFWAMHLGLLSLGWNPCAVSRRLSEALPVFRVS